MQLRLILVAFSAGVLGLSGSTSATEANASSASLRHPFGPASVRPVSDDASALSQWASSLAVNSGRASPEDTVLAYVASKGLSATVTNIVESPHLGLAHVHLVQTFNGKEVANAVANANVDIKTNRIVSFSSSFASAETTTNKPAYSKNKKQKPLVAREDALVPGSEDIHSPLEALDFFFAELGIHPASQAGATVMPHPQRIGAARRDSFSKHSKPKPGVRPFRLAPDYEITLPTISQSSFAKSTRDVQDIAVPATLKYFLDDDKQLVPVWDFEVDFGNHYYHAHVDARTTKKDGKKTLGLIDWVSENYFSDLDDSTTEVVYERIVERVYHRHGDKKKAQHPTRHGKKQHSKFRKGVHVGKKSVHHGGHKASSANKASQHEVQHDKKKVHDVIVPVSSSSSAPRDIKSVYNVFPLGTNDPLEGDRNIVSGPLSEIASPNGWHWCSGGKQACPNGDHTVTIGNNVYAQENLDGGYNDWENKERPDGTSKLYFDFPADLKQDPETYVDAAVVNLFYWNNAIHDLFYVYGFNEAAGNFQDNNRGERGLGGDSVIANAQDGSGHNNANFATPPDGTHGRMRMYVWDVTDPWRDGDFEGGIIMHEYAHGISTRLTGGPANSGCLGFGEAGGMGEGWGDFFATITRMTPETTRKADFGMGEYANGGSGIRKYKYSTSNVTNPSVYSFVNKPGYWGVHAKGEVWAEILYEVFWNIVEAHGWNPDWFDTVATRPLDVAAQSNVYTEFRTGRQRTRSPIVFSGPPEARAEDPFPLGGNVLMLQLVVDGMKIQPCNPSFVDARDAILKADEFLTGEKNKCLLWKGFAKRGLGFGAVSGGVDSFKLPKDCRDK
ncbi:Fungalysin/Thermolysin Extracellular metalloproteinase 5 [Rhizoclosmatium hyalinum]|nr:Fungalysin/Thermolysin Extracellular metalloproteinase 5 [Rhizoclosmatium hyalinum]